MSTEIIAERRFLRKGQAFASDFLISAVLFIAILIASMELWNITALKYSNTDSSEFMQKKAFSITDTLIKTEGYPKNWTYATVKLIGISEGTPQILNKSKLLEMKNIGYSDLKSIWGVGDYDVHLNFTNISGNTVVLDSVALEYGQAPLGQKDLLPLKRLVIINDSGNLIRSVLTFIIWR